MAASLAAKSKPKASEEKENLSEKPEQSNSLPKPKLPTAVRKNSSKSQDLSTTEAVNKRYRKASGKNSSVPSKTRSKQGNDVLTVEIDKRNYRSDLAVSNRLRDLEVPACTDHKLLVRRSSYRSALSSSESGEGPESETTHATTSRR